MASLREATPWWIKVAGKLVLSPLPVPYRAWRSRPFHALFIFSLDLLVRENP